MKKIIVSLILSLLFIMPSIADDGYSTLPGWSAGYRYNYNADDTYKTKLRLFLKRKSMIGHIIKLSWEKQTGVIPNMFRSGTYNGQQLDTYGSFYIEQEWKF